MHRDENTWGNSTLKLFIVFHEFSLIAFDLPIPIDETKLLDIFWIDWYTNLENPFRIKWVINVQMWTGFRYRILACHPTKVRRSPTSKNRRK